MQAQPPPAAEYQPEGAGMSGSAPITTSIFELFKAGPGPSSSYTIAPMAAGLDFRVELASLGEEMLRE